MKTHIIPMDAKDAGLLSKTTQVRLAMLSLDTFTVGELSRFSRVLPATVRTIVDRSRSVLEAVAVEPTNRRGGQPIRYKLSSKGREEIEAAVQASQQQVKSSVFPLHDWFAGFLPLSDTQMPLGLKLAADTTERLVNEARTDREKLDLLEIAEREARGALQDADPGEAGMALRIDRAVEKTLTQIKEMRASIERVKQPVAAAYNFDFALERAPIPDFAEPVFETAADAGPLTDVQIWSAIPMKSKVLKRIARDFHPEILPGIPEDIGRAQEVGDAVVLLVDSGNARKAQVVFDQALKMSHAVSKPMGVLDMGYDQEFRRHVYGSGIRFYCNDAGSLDTDSMRVVFNGVRATAFRENES